MATRFADWVSTSPQHTTRIKIMRLGPVGIAIFALLIGILALAAMALLVGASLVGIAAGPVLIFGGSSPASRAVRFGDRELRVTRALKISAGKLYASGPVEARFAPKAAGIQSGCA